MGEGTKTHGYEGLSCLLAPMTRTSLETVKCFEKLEIGLPTREGTTRWRFDHILFRGRKGGLDKGLTNIS